MAELFIEKGTNVNQIRHYDSPLTIACKSDRDSLKLVELLIKNGADVNQLDLFGCSPIYHACEKGDKAMVELLMKNGADVNRYKRIYRCFSINLPIQVACEYGRTKLVKYLVENGAKLEGLGYSLFDIICKNYNDESLELIKYLVDHGVDVNDDPYNKGYPMRIACSIGDRALPLVKYFATIGVDLNCADKNGMYPIHIACKQGSGAIKIIKYLIGKGVNVSVRTRFNELPSSLTNNVEILLLLAAERISQYIRKLCNP